MKTIQRNTIMSIARDIIEKRAGPEYLKGHLSAVLHLDGKDFALAYAEVSKIIKLGIRQNLEFAKMWEGV